MANKYYSITRERTETGISRICMHGSIYSYHIYGPFWNELTSHMFGERPHNCKTLAPIISLEDVTWIDSAALPLLLSSCKILKAYYKTPIHFIHPLKDEIRNYLFYSEFNSLALGYRNGIKSFSEQILYFDENKASSFHENRINKGNKMKGLFPDNKFYSLSTKEKEIYKYYYLDLFAKNVSNSVMGKILFESFGGYNSDFDQCVTILSELMCNAFLYSKSETFINIQMKSRRKYYFTICDTGIGFKESINLKNEKTCEKQRIDPFEAKKHLNTVIGRNITNLQSFNEFFAFFTALQYSNKTQRTSLSKLIELITSVGGTVKIHFDRFLLCFWGADDFYSSNTAPYEWMNHILDSYSYDYKVSPLCIYKSRDFRGVHIEVIFEKG